MICDQKYRFSVGQKYFLLSYQKLVFFTRFNLIIWLSLRTKLLIKFCILTSLDSDYEVTYHLIPPKLIFRTIYCEPGLLLFYHITVGVNRIETLFIHELLSLGCISFKNPHHQEEVLRIPKHTLLFIFYFLK